MNTTVEQLLAALNEEPHKALDAFLRPEDYAVHLHAYVNLTDNNKHNMQQPIDPVEIHRLAAAFGAYLISERVVDTETLGELVEERAALPDKMPMILWGLNEDSRAYFMRSLNSKAQQALRDRVDLITCEELLSLDPWFVILRDQT